MSGYDDQWTAHLEKFLRAMSMYGRYSDSGIRRLRAQFGLNSKRTRAESLWIRNCFLYLIYIESEMERCAEMKAHFAVGILTLSAIEVLLHAILIEQKFQVAATSSFRRLAKSHPRQSKANVRNSGLVFRLLRAMKLEDLMNIAREMQLISLKELSAEVGVILQAYGYTKDDAGVSKFLRDCRNQVHPSTFMKHHSKVDAALFPDKDTEIYFDGVVDPRPSFANYYYDFAFIATRVHAFLKTVPAYRNMPPI